jgi:type 1 glutamine amidotransferase
MKKWFLRILLGLAVIAVVCGALYYLVMRELGFYRTPVYETVAPTLPTLPRPAVLVFSKTNGYIHKEALPAAKILLQQLANKRGWSLFLTDNSAIYNAADLAKFDVVIWNNVSGDVLSNEQRSALQHYLENGGGFVGLHGAGGDPRYAWSWYPTHALKAQFIGHPLHPQFQQATMHIEDRNDSIMQGLLIQEPGATWQREDEWYSFAQSPRLAGVHVLATIDENSYQPEIFGKSIRMGADHPIIWKHCVENGRIFYSALGHSAETYREPNYQLVLEHAIAWAAGLEGTLCIQGHEQTRPAP